MSHARFIWDLYKKKKLQYIMCHKIENVICVTYVWQKKLFHQDSLIIVRGMQSKLTHILYFYVYFMYISIEMELCIFARVCVCVYGSFDFL